MTEELLNNIIDKLPGDPILIGYGGSISYGTNTEESDEDIRGIYLNSIDEFIGTKKDSEQVSLSDIDATIYSLKKMMGLLSDCNPNTIEILGLRPEHYLFMSNYGQKLIDNKSIFLSQRAVFTFGCYARSQMNRLINKSGNKKKDVVGNETRSLQKLFTALKKRYPFTTLSAEERDGEIIITTDSSMPLKQLITLYGEISNVHMDYKDSKRNKHAIEHNKLSKHMMHLLRLYMMGIDILERGEIITYRENEHDLLMSIRNGDYLEEDLATPKREFEKLVTEYEQRFNKAAENTVLPKLPDYDRINNLQKDIVLDFIKRKGHYE